MIVIVTLFQKLETVKDLFRPFSKKHRLTINMLKGPKLLQYEHESAFIIFFITQREPDLKTSPAIICEILKVFPNTLAASEKYPVQDCENLSSPIQMQLS